MWTYALGAKRRRADPTWVPGRCRSGGATAPATFGRRVSLCAMDEVWSESERPVANLEKQTGYPKPCRGEMECFTSENFFGFA
jgi:hypothetical protein